jgi:hypothetical protein
MAARQDQGLQIALIILIFLFILSAVAAYIGWKSYSDSEQRGAEFQTQLTDKNGQVTNLQTENEELRTMMGFGANDNMPAVKTAYETDMKTMGAAVADETRRYYKDVLKSVYAEAQMTAAREAEAKEQNKSLTTSLAAVNAESEKQLSQYRDSMKKLEEDAAARKLAFDKYQADYDTAKKELLANLDTQRTELEAQIAQRDNTIKENTAKITELERAVANWREQVPSDTESFEIADGRISWVNQNGTVWINAGEADALRRQITFNVYDADEHDAGRATKKGSIEVTRVLGDHMAEAKVTEDDPSNPIMTGDNIYSPVWHRGKKLRFALNGIVDFDGDGVSDLDLARELIELNGGAVDAYLGLDGKVAGKVTAHTRYLVLGEPPESALDAKMQQGFQDINKTADMLGIESIPLELFLNQMGYTSTDRTVRLGAGARGQDFPARDGDGSARSEVEVENEEPAKQFRPRTPFLPQIKTPY